MMPQKGRKKSLGLIKLNYEKDYARVSWDFLEDMLLTRGFGSKWINWFMSSERRFNLY
jgi:hypothetical protein